ncbi:MAG TPA: hypothetical protein VG405_07055 [Solirubrobacteraceae bacterium]|nr:hypothetical protein [Solirubrobacteraceae bacterium]
MPPTAHGEPAFVRVFTFNRLEAVSLFHSCVYVALLICAFALGNPQPATFILGMSHGCIWIAMSLICIGAARYRVIPFWLAVTVAVLGGLGPFFGSIGFIRESRKRQEFA